MNQEELDYQWPGDYQLPGGARRTHVIECVIDITEHTQLSEAVDLAGYALVGLIVPTMSPTCNLHFYVAETEAGTYYEVINDDGSAFAIASGTGDCAVSTDHLAALAGYRWVKIEAQAEQIADRTFRFIVKG